VIGDRHEARSESEDGAFDGTVPTKVDSDGDDGIPLF
jgi:hypothetical protein